jgi:hypothetical protein
MCLHVKDQIEPLIADRDIKCWKEIEKSVKFSSGWQSSYQFKEILFNRILYSILTEKDERNIVFYGFHTFKTRKDARISIMYWRNLKIKNTIVRAIIPKGSRYWLGSFTTGFLSSPSYCSDAIIYSKPDSKNN